MTDDKKHDDKDRKKVSDEELEDVAGGGSKTDLHHGSKGIRKDVVIEVTSKKRGDGGPLEQEVTLDPEKFTKT